MTVKEKMTARSENDNNNGDLVQEDPPAKPHRSRRPRGNQVSMGPHGPIALVAPVHNQYIKKAYFLCKA